MHFSSVNNSSSQDLFFSSEVFHVLYLAANCGNILTGLPTNCVVLWLVAAGSVSSLATEFFTINLTVLEILYVPANVLVLACPSLSHEDINTAVHFFSGLNCFGRHLFMGCICVERYLAVVHPMLFLKFKSLKCKGACSGIVWVTTLAFCGVSMYCKLSSRYYKVLLVYWIGIFLVKLFCVVSVLLVLKRPGPGDKEGETTDSAKLKAFKILLVIAVTMATVYVPMFVAVSLTVYFLEHDIQISSLLVTYSVTMLTGFVHPALYLNRAGKLPCVRHT